MNNLYIAEYRYGEDTETFVFFCNMYPTKESVIKHFNIDFKPSWQYIDIKQVTPDTIII